MIVLDDRFWSKVDKNGPEGFHSMTGARLGPCWVWVAARNDKGYGQFRIDRRTLYAHRLSYIVAKGAGAVGVIPPGLELDHLCRNHACCNPTHLEAVPPKVNFRRGARAGALGAMQAEKTHCPHGHAYSIENTYYPPNKKQRMCRACVNASVKRYQARKGRAA